MDTVSPPLHTRNLIQEFDKTFKVLSSKIKSKKRAIEKLNESLPKSIKSNIELQLSKDLLDDIDTSTSLKQRFKAAKNEFEAIAHVIIIDTAKHELTILNNKRDTLLKSYEDKIISYFKIIHLELQIINPSQFNYDFTSMVKGTTTPNDTIKTSLAVIDCMKSLDFLNKHYQSIVYNNLLATTSNAIIKKDAEEKKNESVDVEMESSNEVLVAQLVQRELQKQTSKFSKQLNQLSQKVNNSTSAERSTTGGKKPYPQRQHQQAKNVGEKVKGQPNEKNSKKPTRKQKQKQNQKKAPKQN